MIASQLENIRLILQGALLLANDGLFFEHRREEFDSQKSIEEATGKTLLGVLAHTVLRANKPRGPVFA